MIRARASRAGPETPAWTLLRSHEERFEDLGLSGPFLKAAFVGGPLVAAVVFLFVNVVLFLKRRRVADSMVVNALFDLFGIALAYFLYAA